MEFLNLDPAIQLFKVLLGIGEQPSESLLDIEIRRQNLKAFFDELKVGEFSPFRAAVMEQLLKQEVSFMTPAQLRKFVLDSLDNAIGKLDLGNRDNAHQANLLSDNIEELYSAIAPERIAKIATLLHFFGRFVREENSVPQKMVNLRVSMRRGRPFREMDTFMDDFEDDNPYGEGNM